MLKLYAANNSICTQRVLIALAEKGLSFDTRNIDLFRNEQYAPWYLAINPEGVVPALDHNGNIVIESSLICEYLDEFFPTRPLKPAGTHARARMRLWSKAVDEGLFEATRELSFSAIFRDQMRRMAPQEREVRFRNVGDPVKRARFMSIYVEGVDSSYVFQGIAQFERAFDKMEKDLSDGQWLVGARLTLADISLMLFVARLAHLDLLDVWLSDRPASNAWWKRVQKLPSFKTAIQAQLSKSDITAMRTSGGKIRSRVAERRQDYLNQVSCRSAQLKDTKEVIDDQNR
jgi:glutathione S-transferase